MYWYHHLGKSKSFAGVTHNAIQRHVAEGRLLDLMFQAVYESTLM